MKKNTKAAAILELLNKGMSGVAICRRLKVSPGYVSTLKKQMAHKAEEPSVVEDLDKFMDRERQGGPKPGEFIEVEGGPLNADQIDKILDQRADQYGSFMQSADSAIRIKGIIHNAVARNDMHMFPDQLLALDMIAVKISRIIHGNAAHRDSWLDIAGYAKLVADRLGGISR